MLFSCTDHSYIYRKASLRIPISAAKPLCAYLYLPQSLFALAYFCRKAFAISAFCCHIAGLLQRVFSILRVADSMIKHHGNECF